MARTYILRTTGVYVSRGATDGATTNWQSIRLDTNNNYAQVGRYQESGRNYAFYIQYLFDQNELSKLQSKNITQILFKIKTMNTINNDTFKIAYAYYDDSTNEAYIGNQAGTEISTTQIASLVNIKQSFEYEFSTYELPINSLPGFGYMIGSIGTSASVFDNLTTIQGEYTAGLLYITTDENPVETLNTYTIPMTLTGFTSADSTLVRQGNLKTYTISYSSLRIGATANYAQGYAIRAIWPENNATVNYLKTLKFSEIKSITLHIVFSSATGHNINIRCGELLEDNYAKITTKSNMVTEIESGVTETYNDITTIGISDLGYGIGGTFSSANNIGVVSSEIIVETCVDVFSDNYVYIVNNNSTLDRYQLYIVENNNLVPYKVTIVNSDGTLDNY